MSSKIWKNDKHFFICVISLIVVDILDYVFIFIELIPIILNI